MQEFSVRLDSRDHARRHVVATPKPPDFCVDAGSGAGSEFSQQAAFEARVESQTLGNRQHNLPVRDRGANFLRATSVQSVRCVSGSRSDSYSATCRKRRRTSRDGIRGSDPAQNLPADRRT